MIDELIGKTIGGYVIEKRIGRGGMATVYEARQTSMNRTVALKVLPREFSKDDTYLQRFEREVSIVAQLEHRNIVPVYDHGEFEGQPYIVMRFMRTGSVDQLLENGPLHMDKILKVITQIAPALDYAHSKNVLHRDLKPSNVLLDDNGDAYLTDFGIARVVGIVPSGQTITTQGVVGTPSYMSPEQAQGHELDGRSDIYSLGVMLFEMATGRRPFISDTPYSIAVMQVMTPPPPPRKLNAQITYTVEQVILKALKKKPDERYQTATSMAEALRIAYERPTEFAQHQHDTQPSPIPVRQMIQETQPSPLAQFTQQARAQNAHASAPPSVMSQPSLPHPASASRMNPPTPGSSRPVREPFPARARANLKRNRSSGAWVGVVIGALIGCGLLTAVVLAISMLVDQLFNPRTGLMATLEAPLPTRQNLPPTSTPPPIPSGDSLSLYSPDEVLYWDESSGTAVVLVPALDDHRLASDSP
jgi:serine/threonine protein kinase